MAKFTFPVPGRRQKKVAPSPQEDISGPLTKAQKILGTGGLNVDLPLAPKDRPRFWESRSNSGISISISESTTGYTNDTNLGRLDEGEVVNGVSGRPGRWDDESAILPRSRNGPGPRGHTAVGGGGNDTMTDASSIRRQRSSSTINTYYDKSKVPLSISQQTAASAMAKGLPAKASALLHMDGPYTGPYSEPLKPRKVKPSKLDLSYLLPKSMSSKHLSPRNAVQKGLVLGPDLVTRSPSIISASPHSTPPPIQQRTDRKPPKKLTLETLRDHRLEPTTHSGTHKVQTMRTASSVSELNNLYEHYEQRSFEEMMGEATIGSKQGGSPKDSSYRSASGGRAFLSPYANSSRAGLSSRDRNSSHMGGAETPATSLMTPSSLNSPATDSASVSSRHTRTSKASKRTDRSMTDLDLRQMSVLSLSSDSEDDYDDRPSTSLSVPRRPSDSTSSPTSPNLSSFPQPPSPLAADVCSSDLPLRRSGPTRPNAQTQSSPLGSTAANTRVTPPDIAARTSSLSTSSQETQKPNANSTSRFSLASTATAKSATNRASVSRVREESANQDFRPIAFIPAMGFRHPRGSQQQTMRLSNASDQSTPLSPTSIDFYLQSQHNSMAFDAGSIRSRMSMGTVSGASMRSSVASTVAGDDGSGRFIAVTRQEEMLLAALRNKRAKMRDDMMTEFEEEHSEETDAEGVPLHHPQPQHRYDQRTFQQIQTTPSQPPTSPAKQRLSSESKRSSRQVSRNSSLSTVRLASLPEQPHAERTPPPDPSASTPPKTNRGVSDVPSPGEERVLLYIDRPPRNIDVAPAEPSPGLDDFSDFDFLGGDFAQPAPSTSSTASLSNVSNASTTKTRTPILDEADLFPAVPASRHPAGGRPGLPKLKSRFNSRQSSVEDVHVRIRDDGTDGTGSAPDESDMPRPDSPVSPAADLPLSAGQVPRKKLVRLSAVGYRPMEAGLWGDDG